MVTVAVVLLAGCDSRPAAKPDSPASIRVASNAEWHFAVQGMHCEACAAGIRSELMRLAGVADADVRLKTEDAQVKVDTNRVSAARIIEVIQESGYQASRVAR